MKNITRREFRLDKEYCFVSSNNDVGFRAPI
jgi:hypothetical protein